MVLEDTLQHTLMEMKSHTWAAIEELSSINPNGKFIPEEHQTIFQKAEYDFQHTKMLNSMLSSSKPVEVDSINHQKCEDAAAFRHIQSFFQTNTDRLLKATRIYTFDFNELIPQISNLVSQEIILYDEIFPHFSIRVSPFFVVWFIFSIDHQLLFLSVHGTSENKFPTEQSEFRVYRALTVYFSRALPDFMQKYHQSGLLEFIVWLMSYENFYSTRCQKCEKIFERDLTGDLLPPIVRTVAECHAYHIKCSPFEIELPDFGYVTLMSEDQMQDKIAHATN
ncbi:mediator of RNA polymerase II transcription subunit 27 [Histomonas meleagridis]|uniref:mediator of RNA polymerase II transcription subunit 27 n=1 Tax=Histomonas meleagridis TaxID=135588 RepID=UPI00355A71A8|nr:mediator of RNA polymerase II transcription subunit 27 [Histomonas meleagridis]KAH0798953.1 mediator of RNA polymerase II transcription subunit 27 [Histomonas meleagridis]